MQRTCQRGSDELLTRQLGDKERQADADRRYERVLGLFGREHEHGEEQLAGEEHLDEEALRDGRVGAESSVDDGNVAGKHARHQRRSDDASDDLGREENGRARPR